MNLEKINVGGNEYDICDAKTRAMVSDEYDPEGDYVAGDLCIHDNKLHEAKGPTTGAWDSTKWEGRTLAEVLKSQNSKIEGLKSSNLNVDITPASGISSVYEYFRYSTIGNLCIVDIGGIIFSSSGLAQEATGSDIPTAKTRPIGILSTDPTEISQPGNTTLMYGSINNTYLVCHIPPGMEGKKLYGQIVYVFS